MPPLPSIAYAVRRSARARYARVQVTAEGEVQVILPRGTPQRRAAALVREHERWIERRLDALQRAQAEVRGPEGTVPYLGRALALAPEPGRTRVHRSGERLLVPAADPAHALERWYRRSASVELAPRVARAAAEVGVRPGPISVRGQRTRWGSCSSSGALSFNWRLLLAPEPVLDYVVLHEVCHLAHPDHSPRFWALVERHDAAWREPATWLRRHGSALTLPV